MTFIDLLITSIGLAMDATAVAICKGLCMRKFDIKKALLVGGMFGLFQGLMPFLGYHLGVSFKTYITAIDHWIAFGLLGFIGFHMLREGLDPDPIACDVEEFEFQLSKLLPLAVATSIDALAVGITFAFLSVQVAPAVLMIGIVTFILSTIGVRMGYHAGQRLESKARILGGVILMGMGIRILVEHLASHGFLA